jgi:hypothetical protein
MKVNNDNYKCNSDMSSVIVICIEYEWIICPLLTYVTFYILGKYGVVVP